MKLIWNKPRAPGPKPAPGVLVDPYLHWALATGWQGFEPLAGWAELREDKRIVRFIAKAPAPEALAALQAIVALEPKDRPPGTRSLSIPPIYFDRLPGTRYLAPYFTGSISLKGLREWLVPNPLKLVWRLAVPLRDAEQAAQASAKGLYGPDRDRRPMRATNVLREELKEVDENDTPALLGSAIAIIDFGCPFANETFLSRTPDARWATRVAALWDQGHQPPAAADERSKDRGWPWRGPCGFDHGRQLGPQALNLIAHAARTRPDLEEMRIYRGLEYLIDYRDERRRVWYGTHGGHLLDVAGGKVDPLSQVDDDKAASAPLVFVQLPLPAALDSAGASLSAYVLDALRYAMARVKAGGPLVVNISYGALAGPHDGSSLIERAIDDLVVHSTGTLAVVVAAGNARRWRGHARRELRRDRSGLLRLQLPADDTTDTFVECWYTPPHKGHVEARLRPPGGDWGPWVKPGRSEFALADTPSADAVAMLRSDLRTPGGDRALLLLALAPSAVQGSSGRSTVPGGIWELELRVLGRKSDAVVIDAWIERDDPARYGSGERPAFLDQTPDDQHDTLNSLAGGERTVCVGGFNLRSRQRAPYSSLDRPDKPRITVLAACEQDEDQPTIQATGTRTGDRLRLNGTSVAAPVLARRLYNALLTPDAAKRHKGKRDAVQLAKDLAGQEQPYLKPA